jgi:hypothetical protein
MSDDVIRSLERRWLRTNAVEDEEAWLRARQRAGELSRERLRLLACLGHAASARIEPADPNPLAVEGDPDLRDFFGFWCHELHALDASARVALSAAVAELLLRHCEPGAHGGDLVRLVDRLRATALDELDPGPQEMARRIHEMNAREQALDHGSIMPFERTAARGVTDAGRAVLQSDHEDWVAMMDMAASSLCLCDPSMGPRAAVAALSSRLIPILLGRAARPMVPADHYRSSRAAARIRVAAYLGLVAHEAGLPGRGRPEAGLRVWLDGLWAVGHMEAVARALLAATRNAACGLEPGTPRDQVESLLDRVEHDLALGLIGYRRSEFAAAASRETSGVERAGILAALAATAIQRDACSFGQRDEWAGGAPDPSASRAVVQEWVEQIRRADVPGVTPTRLYLAARDELTPWAQGEHDPISARVQARLAR